jgi:hopene-associated glycosyltransferase HpnB
MTGVWFVLCALSLAIWVYLLVARGGFWLMRERNEGNLPAPATWPSITAVVPARDEADVISCTIGSLLKQNYSGEFRIIVVDDQSSDGTAAIAISLDDGSRLHVINGALRPPGWTGKLWAVAQGVAHANESSTADFLWLTDADIAHAPDNLQALVARAEGSRLVLVSEMAKLHCATPTERFLIPAFVFFFDMLYPFAWVNNSCGKTAAAAGGSMLVRREALEAAGGIAAIRTEIIDDCALARLMKTQGGIWLGLTELAQSIRPYESIGEIGRMVSRSAYAQLRYSPFLLVGTIVGMLILFAVPPIAALDISAPAGIAGILAWTAMAVSFQPMLRFYRSSPLWALALPLIGLVYTAFTLDSALQFWRGRGGMWKGRAQAMAKG